MKKLFFLLIILISLKGFGQVYQVMPQYGYQMQRADIQQVLRIPSDTTNNKTGIARIGTTLYTGNGTYWAAVTGGGGGGTDTSTTTGFGLIKTIASNNINLKVDSATVATQYKLNLTNAQVTANTAAINQRQLFTDTTTYDATKYDLSIIDNKISSKIIKPIISDAEDNKPSLDLIQKSTNSYTRGWIDGQFLWTVNDTLRSYGGWFTGNTIYDTIYRSTDAGVTWQKESFALPYPVHTVSNCVGTDGYNYMIGGDPFTTLTQRSTVSRTKNGGRTWETMTTTAPFINILGSSWMDEKGNLYHGGGQNDFAGSLCDTLWKSKDGGATWSIYATGMTILGGNTSNLVKYFNGRAVLATGGVYNPPSSTYTKKTYSFEINNPTAWVEHSDVPSATGLQYANAIVFDGKYWLIQGANALGNTNNIYYLDKNFKWSTYYNYTDNIKANVLPISHANGIAVYRNKIIVGVGNDLNATYALEPSSYQTYTSFRDSIKVGNLTHLSQIEGSFATLLGYNVKAGFANNTIRRISNAEVGSYYHHSPAGHYWGRLSTGYPINTDFSDTSGMQLKLNSSGELLLTDNNTFDAGAYKLQVSGNSYFSGQITAPNYAGNNAIIYAGTDGLYNNGNNLTFNNRLSIGGTSGLVYPPTYGISSLSGTTDMNGIGITNTNTGGYSGLLLGETTSNYGGFYRWNTTYGGNYTGTSVPFANTFQIQSGNSNQHPVIVSSGRLIHNVGVVGTNAALRSDANGLRIGRNSNIHTANTVQFEVEGVSTFNGNVTVPGTASNTFNWAAASGTPTNTTTAVGWVRISINGVAAWLPYYQ